MAEMAARPAIAAVGGTGADLSNLSGPKYTITLTNRDLEQLVGPQARDQAQQTLQTLKKQLECVRENHHLLDEATHKRWTDFIAAAEARLCQAKDQRNGAEFLKELQQFNDRLKPLSRFFEDERAQGLVAVHAKSGVRIYGQTNADGTKAFWLVTPDKDAFSDCSEKDLAQFVKGVSSKVRIDHTKAEYQNEGLANGKNLLGCRMDVLQLDRSPANEVHKVSTTLRPGGAHVVHEIAFAQGQLDSTKLVVDAARGFGHGNNFPTLAIDLQTPSQPGTPAIGGGAGSAAQTPGGTNPVATGPSRAATLPFTIGGGPTTRPAGPDSSSAPFKIGGGTASAPSTPALPFSIGGGHTSQRADAGVPFTIRRDAPRPTASPITPRRAEEEAEENERLAAARRMREEEEAKQRKKASAAIPAPQ